jgi:cyclopropane fatty-acyl-phospholipid synthase-like methyltransferase
VSLLDRLAPRRSASDGPPGRSASVADPVFATKALRKFLASIRSRETPALLDLGPVVGSNVSFFGEQVGCKIFVEDIFADLDRHVRGVKLEGLPDFLGKRFPQADGEVDGILCWDIFDYLDRAAAQQLAQQLTRVLRPDGALLAFFGTAQPRETRYTKYLIVDEVNLQHRTYPAARGRQASLLNRDIIRLFPGLRVSDSFLLQNNLREVLFRKPA